MSSFHWLPWDEFRAVAGKSRKDKAEERRARAHWHSSFHLKRWVWVCCCTVTVISVAQRSLSNGCLINNRQSHGDFPLEKNDSLVNVSLFRETALTWFLNWNTGLVIVQIIKILDYSHTFFSHIIYTQPFPLTSLKTRPSRKMCCNSVCS